MKQKRKGDGIIVRLQERQQWKQHNFVPGSRIVWFDDKSQAQPGTVLWIGEINGQTGVFAGVNFDNPIGSGANGRLSGRQLFKAKLDHAAFVQTHGLFSEEEYLELATSNKSTAKAITNNQEVEICDKADPEAAIARKELAVGDRIAWLDLTVTPQFGTIRWIGRLESHEHLFAEIDFDEPLVCLSSYNAASTQNSNGANGRSGFLQVDHIVREEDYRAEHNVRDVQEFQDCGWVDVSDDNHKQTKSIATDQKSKENCSDSEKPVNVITETHKLQQTENDVQGPLSDEGIVESDSAMGPIREGERIEWVDPDEQSYFGVVKWIGRLSGYSHIYGGIEFDEPIGGGTGVHETEQIFVAKTGHALFVPYNLLTREKNATKVIAPNANEELETEPCMMSKSEDNLQGTMHRSSLALPIAITAAEIPPAHIECPSEATVWRVDGDFSSPSLFYLHFFRFSDSLKQLNSNIKPPTVVMDEPSVGSLCIAEFRDDWYRAEIITVDKDADAVTVLYIDYGNVEVRKLSEVYHITDDQPEIVRTMHKLAVPCKLDGVERVQAERLATAIEEFQLAFPETDYVKVAFKSVESGVYLVDVTVDELSLIEVLVKDNVAPLTDVTTDQMNENSDSSCSWRLEGECKDEADKGVGQNGFEAVPATTTISEENKSADSDIFRDMNIALKTAIRSALRTKQHTFNVEGTFTLRFTQTTQSPEKQEENSSDSELSVLDVTHDGDWESDFSVVD